MDLYFSVGNAKLHGLAAIVAFCKGEKKVGEVYSFDLPAGRTCPGAKLCKSMAVKTPDGWRIRDGRFCEFRCYSASQEAIFKNVRKRRQGNLKILQKHRSTKRMTDAIFYSLPDDCRVLRIHTSGDFFSQSYFDAWNSVARQRPDVLFYAYTKAIPFWVRRLDDGTRIHMRLIASLGGKWDKLAIQNYLPTCKVVYSPEEAEELNLPIDHDDSYASGLRENCNHFAVLVHGPQPAGSDVGIAARSLNQAGLAGYRRRKSGYHLKKVKKVA